MAELKPCPFCGGEAEITFQSFGVNAIITCKKCHTKFVFPWGETITSLALAEKWNNRAGSVVSAHWEEEEEEDPEYYRFHYCSNCGEYAPCEEDNEFLKPYCPECGAKMDNPYERDEELKLYSNYFCKKRKEERE